ncbi:hypothetical protein [Bdellovibrio svalbardensis]|uniref:Peptidase C39-like domain-containing protein n=1 Tax=Bdellovibrio svalbardensis TaxID=2972972 RepID=A0ABT6DJ03_9BACT|nr:hypothetical protein [Bdellovibrio svalbardensis]MDG0816822.1 hypothetical protein [Bdellovibrio svalbardensis]
MIQSRTFFYGMTLVVTTLFSSLLHAAEINKSGSVKAPTSRKEYCTGASDVNYFKSLVYSYENRLSFLNSGGIGNGGVCWWHSMFTRNATYVAVYRPDLRRADRQKAVEIIADIVDGRAVVEVPGYHNLYEFSTDYHREIQSALNRWQIGEGIAFGWLRGITGRTRVEPGTLKVMMDELYQEVKRGHVTYQKLQIPGIMAHAWLVVDMNKTLMGYDLEVIDSNYRDIRTIHYQKGMTHLNEYNSVPYTSRNSSPYQAYAYAKSNYCRLGLKSTDMRSQLAQR